MPKPSNLKGALRSIEEASKEAHAPPGMFSTATELIHEAPFDNVPWQQWVNYMQPGRMLTRNGVQFPLKQDELDFTNLHGMIRNLGTQIEPTDTGRVSREQLLAHLHAHRTPIADGLVEDGSTEYPSNFSDWGLRNRLGHRESPTIVSDPNYNIALREHVPHTFGFNSTPPVSWHRSFNVLDPATEHLPYEQQRAGRVIQEIQSDIHAAASDKFAVAPEESLAALRKVMDDPALDISGTTRRTLEKDYAPQRMRGNDEETQRRLLDIGWKTQRRGYGKASSSFDPFTGRDDPVVDPFTVDPIPEEIPYKGPKGYGALELRKALWHAANDQESFLTLANLQDQMEGVTPSKHAVDGLRYMYEQPGGYLSELKKLAKQYGLQYGDEIPVAKHTPIPAFPPFSSDNYWEDLEKHIQNFGLDWDDELSPRHVRNIFATEKYDEALRPIRSDFIDMVEHAKDFGLLSGDEEGWLRDHIRDLRKEPSGPNDTGTFVDHAAAVNNLELSRDLLEQKLAEHNNNIGKSNSAMITRPGLRMSPEENDRVKQTGVSLFNHLLPVAGAGALGAAAAQQDDQPVEEEQGFAEGGAANTNYYPSEPNKPLDYISRGLGALKAALNSLPTSDYPSDSFPVPGYEPTPLHGTAPVGDLLMGSAPEEIGKWAHGDSPFYDNSYSDNLTNIGRMRPEHIDGVMSTAFLPVAEATALARGAGRLGTRGVEATLDSFAVPAAEQESRRGFMKGLGGVAGVAIAGPALLKMFGKDAVKEAAVPKGSMFDYIDAMDAARHDAFRTSMAFDNPGRGEKFQLLKKAYQDEVAKDPRFTPERREAFAQYKAAEREATSAPYDHETNSYVDGTVPARFEAAKRNLGWLPNEEAFDHVVAGGEYLDPFSGVRLVKDGDKVRALYPTEAAIGSPMRTAPLEKYEMANHHDVLQAHDLLRPYQRYRWYGPDYHATEGTAHQMLYPPGARRMPDYETEYRASQWERYNQLNAEKEAAKAKLDAFHIQRLQDNFPDLHNQLTGGFAAGGAVQGFSGGGPAIKEGLKSLKQWIGTNTGWKGEVKPDYTRGLFGYNDPRYREWVQTFDPLMDNKEYDLNMRWATGDIPGEFYHSRRMGRPPDPGSDTDAFNQFMQQHVQKGPATDVFRSINIGRRDPFRSVSYGPQAFTTQPEVSWLFGNDEPMSRLVMDASKSSFYPMPVSGQSELLLPPATPLKVTGSGDLKNFGPNRKSWVRVEPDPTGWSEGGAVGMAGGGEVVKDGLKSLRQWLESDKGAGASPKYTTGMFGRNNRQYQNWVKNFDPVMPKDEYWLNKDWAYGDLPADFMTQRVRENPVPDGSNMDQFNQFLQQHLQKGPAADVYRALHLRAGEQFEPLLPSPQSFSLDPGVASQFSSWPDATKLGGRLVMDAKDLPFYPMPISGQNEMLFPPNTPLKVIGEGMENVGGNHWLRIAPEKPHKWAGGGAVKADEPGFLDHMLMHLRGAVTQLDAAGQPHTMGAPEIDPWQTNQRVLAAGRGDPRQLQAVPYSEPMQMSTYPGIVESVLSTPDTLYNLQKLVTRMTAGRTADQLDNYIGAQSPEAQSVLRPLQRGIGMDVSDKPAPGWEWSAEASDRHDNILQALQRKLAIPDAKTFGQRAGDVAGDMLGSLPVPVGEAKAVPTGLKSLAEYLLPTIEAHPMNYLKGTAGGIGLTEAIRGAVAAHTAAGGGEDTPHINARLMMLTGRYGKP